jgi:hypothetical protein
MTMDRAEHDAIADGVARWLDRHPIHVHEAIAEGTGRAVRDWLDRNREELLTVLAQVAARALPPRPPVPDRTDWEPLPAVICPRCQETGNIMLRKSASSDYADEHFRCTACGHSWHVDGPDA